jgi:glycosyltransferase involved in cell wall biosynthesis
MPPGDAFDPRAVWAAAAGVPVITPMSSAAAETVEGLERREPTGVLLDEPTDSAIADGVAFIERHPELFDAERLRAHAGRWSHLRFVRNLKSLVLDAWCGHVAASAGGDADAPAEAFEAFEAVSVLAP